PEQTVVTDEIAAKVEALIKDDHKISTRQIALQLDISHTSVWRILKHILKLYPYKVQLLQALTTKHIEQRILVGNQVLQLIDSGMMDVSKTRFSDEAHFWLNGYVYKQNYRYWADENPHIGIPREAHPQRVTVWCAFSFRGKIGPIFTTQNITGAWFKKLLENEFLPFIRNNNYLEDSIYMQDGATPHRTTEVFDLLHGALVRRVIGLGYP
ncbi:histone-lysine N-methyltransferase SETMAR-like protein, partial [Leptotrombidium deliense]